MNLRDLEYLVALDEHKHFGRAARATFATQPTLSLQLMKLEKELGVKLVERTNRKVFMTPMGKKIAARARTVIGGAKEIAAMALESQDPMAGELHLGVFPTLAPYLLPRIVADIMKAYPGLRLKLVEEKTEVLISRLNGADLDAAFLALPIKEEGLQAHYLMEEEFLLAVAKAHPWAKKKRVSRRELKNRDLLLLEEGHCLRDQALEFCGRVGAGEFPDFRASSMETLIQMVAADVGMTLIPKMAAKTGGPIAYIPFEGARPSRKIGIVWRKSSVRKNLLEDLKKRLASSLSQPA